MKLCFETHIAGFRIALEQNTSYRFTVTYGEQVDRNLSYPDAAMNLGASIMHAVTLEGKLEPPKKL